MFKLYQDISYEKDIRLSSSCFIFFLELPEGKYECLYDRDFSSQ